MKYNNVCVSTIGACMLLTIRMFNYQQLWPRAIAYVLNDVMAGISLIQMAVSQRNNYHFEFSSKGGKIFQFNPWQSTDVAQTLIELERRLGSEWYLRFENCRDNRIDYVLVYKINDEDDARREARERFEERLVEDNLELVRWKKKDCWSLNDSESDEVFVLVHTPFDRLALECQSVKMAMPLKGVTNAVSLSVDLSVHHLQFSSRSKSVPSIKSSLC